VERFQEIHGLEEVPPAPALAQQRNSVANALDFREDVRGHENRAAPLSGLLEQRVKGLLHERIKALGRLVQNEERGVALKRLNKPELAFHAGAVLPQLATQIALREFQSLNEFLATLFVHRLPFQPCEEVEDFEPGQVGVNSEFTGQISDSRPGRQAVQPAIVTENRGRAAGGPEQIEEQADGGGFACAIQTEKAEDLALNDVEVEIVQRGERAVSFREATNRNGGRLRVGGAHRFVAEHPGMNLFRQHGLWTGLLYSRHVGSRIAQNGTRPAY